MDCLRCRYDLAHARDNRCPECGTGFDPTNRLSFRDHPLGLSPAARLRFRAAMGPLLLLLAFLGSVAMMGLLIATVFVD